MMDPRRPWTGFPIVDYPVSLAIWQWNTGDIETPIDGDWK